MPALNERKFTDLSALWTIHYKNKDPFTQQPSLGLSSTIDSLRNNPSTLSNMDPVTTAGAPSQTEETSRRAFSLNIGFTANKGRHLLFFTLMKLGEKSGWSDKACICYMTHKLFGLIISIIISIYELRWWLIRVWGNTFVPTTAHFSWRHQKWKHSSLACFKLLHSLILFAHGWELCSQLNHCCCSSQTGLFKYITEGYG